MFDCLGAEGDVGDVVGGALREDATEAPAAFGKLGVVFAPEFEFVVASYGGEELTEDGGEPLDLGGWVSMGFCSLRRLGMRRASSISAS